MSTIDNYKTADNHTQIDVKFEKDSVWLSQAQISELFQRDRTVITKHINNVFKEGELNELVVSANFAHTTQHGAIKGKMQETDVKHYNLDVIISVGYRVKSQRGTQFRQWATQHLKDYLVQGYAMNQKRLEELQQTTQLISNGSNTKTFLPKNLLFHRQPFLTANYS